MKRKSKQRRVKLLEAEAQKLAEKIARDVGFINESVDVMDGGWLKDQLARIESREDLEDFINKHDFEIVEKSKTLDVQNRSIFQKAWELLKSAVKKTGKFIVEHWYDLLKLLAFILLIWLGYTWFYAPLKKLVKQIEVSGKWMQAPGEMLQQKAAERGEKAISDGYAHFLNQISNLD